MSGASFELCEFTGETDFKHVTAVLSDLIDGMHDSITFRNITVVPMQDQSVSAAGAPQISELARYINSRISSFEKTVQEIPDLRSAMEFFGRQRQHFEQIQSAIHTGSVRATVALLLCSEAIQNDITDEDQNDRAHQPHRRANVQVLRTWKTAESRLNETFYECKAMCNSLTRLHETVERLRCDNIDSLFNLIPEILDQVQGIDVPRKYVSLDIMHELSTKVITACQHHLSASVRFLERPFDCSDFAYQKAKCVSILDGFVSHAKHLKLHDKYGIQFVAEIDLMVRRLQKLGVIASFLSRAAMFRMMELDFGLVEKLVNSLTIRNNHAELLSYSDTRFDREYRAFESDANSSELVILKVIDENFMRYNEVSSVSSYSLITQAAPSLHTPENMETWLSSYYAQLMEQYSREITRVQDLYERDKGLPRVERNFPTVSGCIMWSRCLLRRIHQPVGCLLHMLEGAEGGRRIIKQYNRLARTLIEYETIWYQVWAGTAEACRVSLTGPLLRKSDQEIWVINLGIELHAFMREAKNFKSMRLVLPDVARLAIHQEQRLKRLMYRMNSVLIEYNKTLASVPNATSNLLTPHIDELEALLTVCSTGSVSWISFTADSLSELALQEFNKVSDLVARLNNIAQHRIEVPLKIISRMSFWSPLNGPPVSLGTFTSINKKGILDAMYSITSISSEIERSTEELIDCILLSGVKGIVTHKDLARLKAQFHWKCYRAVMGAVVKSLRTFRTITRSQSAQVPILETEISLDDSSVVMSPDWPSIKDALGETGLFLLQATQSICGWNCSIGSVTTFFDRMVQEKDILKSLFLLMGSLAVAPAFTDEYKHLQLLRREPNCYMSGESGWEARSDHLSDTRRDGSILMKRDYIFRTMNDLQSKYRICLRDELVSSINTHVNSIQRELNDIIDPLEMDEPYIDDLEALQAILEALRKTRKLETDIEFRRICHVTLQSAELGEQFPELVSQREKDASQTLLAEWENLRAVSRRMELKLGRERSTVKGMIVESLAAFRLDLRDLLLTHSEKGPVAIRSKASDTISRLKRFRDEFDVRDRRGKLLRVGEDLVGLHHEAFDDFHTTRRDLESLSELFNLYSDLLCAMENWNSLPIPSDRIRSVIPELESYSVRSLSLPHSLKCLPSYKEFEDILTKQEIFLKLVVQLCKPSIMPRHWEALESAVGARLWVESLTVGSLYEADILRWRDAIFDICEAADKEITVDKKFNEVDAFWSKEIFEFSSWKCRDCPCILLPVRVKEIQEKMEESLIVLSALQTMRYAGPFKPSIGTLISNLSDSLETIDKWLQVQFRWTALESVFTSGDIAKQLPLEAKQFQGIDKEWVRLMQVCSDQRSVVQCCQNDHLRQSLPILSRGLEACQRSLESYLDGKRIKFARFCFISDSVLIKILSQGTDLELIQEDLDKLFEGINRIDYDRASLSITGFKNTCGSTEEEAVDLHPPLQTSGNVEEWLSGLELEMQKAILRESTLANRLLSSVPNVLSIVNFSDQFIAQVAMLGIQIIWTMDTERALDEKSLISSTTKRLQSMLNDLVDHCLTDLGSGLKRTKFETLVTVQVHQRDLATSLFRKCKEHRYTHFDWSKQTRLYWRSCGAVVSIADVDLKYCCEYLGVKERLVITPLTDRCYLTLSQALGICYGGAPVGPAGTGKTETVKDMARTLGLPCIVTNCSDQHRYKDMAKIFKGLCSSGIFGCFDEFNRIELEVLSVVAMQIEAITTAKKQQVTSFLFPGESNPLRLVPTLGYFITMNPGYAGRQKLPENLKNLFRSVSMMVPDREIIMRVKLASAGFSQMDLLGKKFNILYHLCEQQLSKQRHYDFGLRNILSVLRTAGGIKRSEPAQTDEELLFMRTIRDMNLSKLVADDVPVFLTLLNDLFPRVADQPKIKYGEIDKRIDQVIGSRKLSGVKPWKSKIIQLYETSLVRHGLMLVGPTLTGKSEIISIITECLSTDQKSAHRVVKINPKAITDAQMYGAKDALSDEWTPGIFSTIWQKHNNRSLKYNTWIVCDGPVDAIWIENLNSVLDDNKILTLANNDRIPMTENCRIVFEVENLNNASPATVSRAGIIYVSESDLPLVSLIDSCKVIHRINRGLVDKMLLPLHVWLSRDKSIKRVMKVSDSVVVKNFVSIMTGFAQVDEQLTDRQVIHAIVWAVGGLLEIQDRFKFNNHIYLMAKAGGFEDQLPKLDLSQLTLFDMRPTENGWEMWSTPAWTPSRNETFSNVLIPTMDSVRSEHLMSLMTATCVPTLLLGSSGTAKTSTAVMHLSKKGIWKRICLSSATSPSRLQQIIESDIERKTGKTYAPPNGQNLTLFIDDLSMPLVNRWGDQPALELLRQVIENKGFYFLDKDKRGDFKSIENVSFIGSMVNPGGGRNDIPNRLKSKFFSFSLVKPTLAVVDAIYGSIMKSTFGDRRDLLAGVTSATIRVWEGLQNLLVATPQRFHYVFNMRDLARVFQGITSASLETVSSDPRFVSLWRHECLRVFSDKLCREADKTVVESLLDEVQASQFPTVPVTRSDCWWAHFLRADNDGIEPGIYEPVVDMESVRAKAYEYLEKFNKTFPSGAMSLVLFDDALFHLLKITRILFQKRGSAMLVGVGGSGKQSLARLASFICNHRFFRVSVSKSYNEAAFFDDLKSLYIECAQKDKPVTFAITDSDIKFEEILEHLNSIMATGDVAGLFQKDERDAMCNEIREEYRKLNKHSSEDTAPQSALQQFLADRFMDNLHLVYCFSPGNPKFPLRAQKFPAVFSNSNINWFLPWPEAALETVGAKFLSGLDIDAHVRTSLYSWLRSAYELVGEVCEEYYHAMRRRVFVTPKNFLCLIETFKCLYLEKFEEINALERAVNSGLHKLDEASADAERLKLNLVEEERGLKLAESETNSLLVKVQMETVKAEAKARDVGIKRDACLAKKSEIEREQADAEKDLQAALPFLREAEDAVKSITAKDITELKTLKQPSDIIRLVFDGLLLLQQKRVCDVRSEKKNVNKQSFDFIHDSYDEIAKSLLTDIRFLPDLFEFSEKQKDNINNETCELLEPYLTLPTFTPAIAKKASGAAEGLCKWVGAMVSYHQASLIVKPKMDFLRIQESKLQGAMENLREAEADLEEAMRAVTELGKSFREAMDRKVALEASAAGTRFKMDQAEKLISGLAGEKTRWTDDSKNFAHRRNRLVGDCALAASFLSFCGPFNAEFRQKLIQKKWTRALERECILFSDNFNFISFTTDTATIGEWSLHGLPNDDLSVENAIIATRSNRYCLMIDPQGQASRWLRVKEAQRMGAITTLGNVRLKEQIELAMSEGRTLMIENVECELDPILDPLLARALVKKGRNLVIRISGEELEFNPAFNLVLTSRLGNPALSAETFAQCCVVDFTVTERGLEQQLLGRVLASEQQELEESLGQLLREVQSNTKQLQLLDKQLLQRLSESSGNLLDDVGLIEVLARTKQTAIEVGIQLKNAEEKRIEISQKRELYRPIATRGSVLYFSITDMTRIQQQAGWMYNCSLVQFLEQFDLSVKLAEKSQQTHKRVERIVDVLTYQVYRYMNRGLFERDRLLFKLIVTLRSQSASNQDISMFLRAGEAAVKKPNRFPKWLPEKAWATVLQLNDYIKVSGNTLIDAIAQNEQSWKRWYESNEPESSPIPDNVSPFHRLVLVRGLREDRTTVAVSAYIESQLGARFTKPVTDTIESVLEGSTNRKPIMYLLSAGSDPSWGIDELAKKKKRFPVDKVSMGEGQETIALEKLKAGFLTGSWVVLQNCHLGLRFMNQLEDLLIKTPEIEPDFRVWITCEVTSRFPIGLLQMSIKVTMEPPRGLKAGLARTFATTVTQDLLDRIDSDQWRKLVYALAFLHSVVQERRKFGPIGWCVPYEFSNSDLEASLLFLEKHVASGAPISWPTVQYMISSVQYGGRITDSADASLFDTYVAQWFCDDLYKANFTFGEKAYSVPDALEMAQFRDFIDSLPSVDAPSIFGLHHNADFTYRQLEASALFQAIQDTRPRSDSAGISTGGKSREEVVKSRALEILAALPPDFLEDEVRDKISKMKGAPGTSDKGFQAPLNVFLFQEIDRIQKNISLVRVNLTNLLDAIDGNVVMTPELLEDLGLIHDSAIPRGWTHDAGGVEISWLAPNLSAWCAGLTERVDQLTNWLQHGRLKVYWLPGFLNPQGFLTAIGQEVTRQHRKDQWSLDDVVTHATVLNIDADKIKNPPEEGQNISGLYLEGARWNRTEGKLEESETKKLFCPLPVIHVTAVTLKDKKSKGADYGPFGPFECPLYKYPRRTDKYLVMRLNLKTDANPSHWRLRGVAALCSTQ
jgi:dynein heavy chain